MATPGIHLVLIFDPKTRHIFKKMITVNPKDINKEMVPVKLETETEE
jgi:hypothetical protein